MNRQSFGDGRHISVTIHVSNTTPCMPLHDTLERETRASGVSTRQRTMLTISCATRGKESAAHRLQRYAVSRASVRAIGPDLEHGHNRRSVVQSRAADHGTRRGTGSPAPFLANYRGCISVRYPWPGAARETNRCASRFALSPKEAAAVTCTLVRMNDP